MATTRTQTQQKPTTHDPKMPDQGADKPIVKLGDVLKERGIGLEQWRTMDNLFPGAEQASKLMVFDYCRARKLDPMKKPCHIVPMRVCIGKDANGKKKYDYRDVVMAGIYEYRTTAARTGLYMGHTEPEYGGEVEVYGNHGHIMILPQWIRMVFYRWHVLSGTRTEFPVKVQFMEVAAFKDWEGPTPLDDEGTNQTLNDRWTDAPIQMGTKCCEAAGLREAFPDELGGTQTIEEMQGRTINLSDAEFSEPVQRGKPRAEEPRQKETVEGTVVKTHTEVPVAEIMARLDKMGLAESEFCAQFEIGGVNELPLRYVNAAMDYLDAVAAKLEPK